MIKIYIVGAVSGVKNWEDKFIKAKQQYLSPGNTVKTPMDYPPGLTQREYMKLSCKSVFWADRIVVTKEWENSKCTRAEIALAESIGTKVIYM